MSSFKNPRLLPLLLGAAVSLAARNPAAGQEVADKSHTTSDGRRIARLEADIPASLSDVWGAFATDEGLRSWMAPVAAVDMKIGGIMEASYHPDAKIGDPANIKNRILSFAPETMLSLQVSQFPPNYPFDKDKAGKTWSVILFHPISDKVTRVTLLGFGFQKGDDWEKLHQFGIRANSYSLMKLHERFTKGPSDWDKIFEKAAALQKTKK